MDDETYHHNQAGLRPLRAVLPQRLGNKNDLRTWAQPSSNCPRSVAAESAAVLLGCYRKGEAADEEIFTRAIIALFEQYSATDVRAISSPVSGIPSKSKWLPTVSELKAALDERANAESRRQAVEYRQVQQLAERDEPSAATVDERSRAIARWERMKAEMQEVADGISKEAEDRAARQRLSDAQAGLLPRIKISDELLAKLRSEAA